MAALQHVGIVHRRPACRIHCYCGPYRSIQRIRTNRINLFAPLYQWGNNLLAYFAERIDSYAFYSTDVWLKSIPTFIIALVTFVSLLILAWKNGRTYCNTICPVGTVLGLLSRFSLFRPVIDTTKCNGCQLCARNCKASCIDAKNHIIDYSRCVACMDCIEKCRQGAIRYLPRKKTTSESVEPAHEDKKENPRREFLSFTGLLAGTALLKAQEKKK